MVEPRAFLERWSRLKRRAAGAAARHSTIEPPPAPAALDAEAAPARTADPVDRPEAGVPEETALPSVESLTGASDYRPFMRAEVPDALRNEALRKLWASDPVYANLDGLLEYGEDFGEPFRAAGIVATVYRVLEGMPAPVEKAPAAPAPPAGGPPAAVSVTAAGEGASATQLVVNDAGEDGRDKNGGLDLTDNDSTRVGPMPAPRPA